MITVTRCAHRAFLSLQTRSLGPFLNTTFGLCTSSPSYPHSSTGSPFVVDAIFLPALILRSHCSLAPTVIRSTFSGPPLIISRSVSGNLSAPSLNASLTKASVRCFCWISFWFFSLS